MKADFSLKKTMPVFDRIRKQNPKIPKLLILVLLLFVLVFFAAIIATFIGSVLIAGIWLFILIFLPKNVPAIDFDSMTFTLYSTVFVTITVMLYCQFFEKRSQRTLGFTKHKCLRDYVIGILLGIGTFSASVLIAWAGGGLHFDGVEKDISWGMLAVTFFGWLLQGLEEEVMCRGYLMTSIGTHKHPWIAVTVSAVFFAALHLGNDGLSVLALVNLTLFGISAGILFLRTDSIWCCAAEHSLWNCMQGNLYGIKVSGQDAENTIMRFSSTEGKDFLSGGAFGLEGGIAVTIVLTVVIVIFLLLPQRTSGFPKDEEAVVAANAE